MREHMTNALKDLLRDNSLTLQELQVWENPDGREFASVSCLIGETLSTAELDSFGRSAASALGGEPYGTLNLDFSGSVPSLEVLVDLSRC